MLNDLDLSPSDLKLTEADLEDLVKGCSKGKCEFCIKKAGFTGKIENGPFLSFDICLEFSKIIANAINELCQSST